MDKTGIKVGKEVRDGNSLQDDRDGTSFLFPASPTLTCPSAHRDGIVEPSPTFLRNDSFFSSRTGRRDYGRSVGQDSYN